MLSTKLGLSAVLMELAAWSGPVLFNSHSDAALISYLIAHAIASTLLALLILPLYIPVLILGSGALQAALMGMPATGYLLWLGSLTALAVTLTPFAIAAGLKISVGE